MRSARTVAFALFLLAGAHAPANAEDAAAPPSKPAWDRAANIRDAAERIGRIQRVQGAEGAIKFIDACYRTHGLASAYTAAFEACIAQDYLETKLLTRIYARLPPETLKKLGAPTAELLAQSLGHRIVAAFSQYKVSVADAESFKAEVDTHGLPVFLKTVFPNAEAERAAREADKTSKPDGKEKK